nr:hypothetical protein CFP56_03980 [Quercus suber]
MTRSNLAVLQSEHRNMHRHRAQHRGCHCAFRERLSKARRIGVEVGVVGHKQEHSLVTKVPHSLHKRSLSQPTRVMRLSFSSSNRKHFEEPKIFAFHSVTYAQTPTMPRHVCTRRGAVTGVRSSSSSGVSRCERVSAGEGVTSRGGSERALSSASFDHSGVSGSGTGSASDTLGLELMLAGL